MQAAGIPSELSSVPGMWGWGREGIKPLPNARGGKRTTAVESLTVCSQMKGASGTSKTTEDSEGVEDVSVSTSGLLRSSRPPGAVLDLDWGQRARCSFSVPLAIEERLSLFSSPSSMPAKKLLLGWVTANLMGFNKVDDMGEMLVSSELHSESSTGMCFLEGEGRGRQMEAAAPALAAPGLGQDLPTPSTAFEPLRTFLLCSGVTLTGTLTSGKCTLLVPGPQLGWHWGSC